MHIYVNPAHNFLEFTLTPRQASKRPFHNDIMTPVLYIYIIFFYMYIMHLVDTFIQIDLLHCMHLFLVRKPWECIMMSQLLLQNVT